MLDKAKDPIDPMLKKGVYSIPCSWKKVYIGETSRSMKIKLKENYADLRVHITNKYSLAKQSSKTRHHVCLEDAKVIAKVHH